MKRIVAEKNLSWQFKRTTRPDKPSVTDKVIVAKRWIRKGYNTSLVLDFVGLAPSTFYENINRKKELTKEEKTDKAVGRPQTQFSYTLDGKKIPDEQIKEWLSELVCGDGFPYGYKKLTAALVDDYALVINEHGKWICSYLASNGLFFLSGKVLEIRCGSGGILEAFKNEGWEVTGIDLDDIF